MSYPNHPGYGGGPPQQSMGGYPPIQTNIPPPQQQQQQQQQQPAYYQPPQPQVMNSQVFQQQPAPFINNAMPIPASSSYPSVAPPSMMPPQSMNSNQQFRPASVPFFSTAGGGAPVPSSSAGPPSMGGGPPGTSSFQFGGMPPPPTGGAEMFQAMPPPSQQMGSIPGMVPPGSAPVPFYQPPMGQNPGMGAAPMMQNPGSIGSAPMYGAPGQTNPSNLVDASQAPVESQQSQLPTLAELDLSIQCNPIFMRSSVGKVVNSQSAANASRLPLGIICRPMVGDVGTENNQIDVVDFGSTGIIRCKRCRTYINPFVTWVDTGRRWKCNLCGMQNDVPSTYFSHLDASGHRRDKHQRPELSKCSVEFVAPAEYMVRPPQPPVYFFVIDVSSVSASSGMIQACVNAIKASLDEIPGKPRTQIGFITFDTTIHFYNLKSTLKAPQMHVISDITDIILPLPEDLLVNLQDSRAVVDALLDNLPSMFRNNTAVNCCTGPALSAAKAVVSHIGGKICLFQSSLPSIGEGVLKPRDNPRLLGTDKEHLLLNAEEPWYKNFAIDCSRLQIAIDTYLFSGQYTDLASLSILSKATAGTCHYYPTFYAPRDGVKFERELQHCLTRATAFEAVIRVRATRGLRIANFYGNHYVRGTDLLALPNCTADSTFGFDIQYDEPILSAQAIAVQAALLYTTSDGERRIRVHTMLIPVTTSINEMLESVDMDCAMNILSKQAIDIAQKTGLDNARQRVNQVATDILRASKGFSSPQGQYGNIPGMPGGGYPGQPQQMPSDSSVHESLQLLPLYSMSLQKSLILRGGTEVRIDERAFYHLLVQNMSIEESKVFVYPRMFSIHNMENEAGVPSDNADDGCAVAGPFRVRLPSLLNLESKHLISNGIFLLENGYEMCLWIGRSVNPAILSTLFGIASLDGIDMSTMSILADNSDYSSRVNAIIVALRQERSRYMHLHFIREGDGYGEAFFARFLVEDRANFPGGTLSYEEYHMYMSRQVGGL